MLISTSPLSLSQPPSFQPLTEENRGNRLQQPQSPPGPFIEMMAEEHMGPSEEQPSTSECQPPSHDLPVEENKISKYLTLPDIPIKPTNKATTSTHQTGARIVTSQQFLKVLREKEKKKQLEEEKMLRKLERERKRKEQKEAVQKRKEERLLAKRTVKTSALKTTTLKKSVSKTLPQTTSKTSTSKRTKHTKYLES